MKKINLLLLFLTTYCISIDSIGQTSGDLQKWHRVALTFDGPITSETAMPNPFTYYRMDVTFTHEDGYPIYKVPGFYAADGKADETSSGKGNKWRAYFSPDKVGNWSYSVSFKAGEDIALREGGTSAAYFDGEKGSFMISESDKSLPDNRAQGRLNYVGEHYLQYSDSEEYLIKVGADSPENMLHYEDFDGTLNGYGKLAGKYLQLMKTWEPHAKDYDVNAEAYTWQGGKGKNLLGAVNYLAGLGVNAISFLTFSVDGDDGCIYPHLVQSDSLFIEASGRSKSWIENKVIHDRFDVSKLDQWEKILSYADHKGMFLHFKTFENESASLMGRYELSDDRKLYYRELIARFGHHLSLNWNLSEETNTDVAVVKSTASYISNLDPYNHHLVQHTFPKGHKDNKKRPSYDYYYNNLVGFQSDLTGASLQLQKKDVHEEIVRWYNQSEATGKVWAIANDEQGRAGIGVSVDMIHESYTGQVPDNRDEVRKKVLWGALMGGAFGVEYYYGYKCESNDLTAEDHRPREVKYKDAIIAKSFFDTHLDFTELKPTDDLTAKADDYVLAGDKQMVVYLPKGGSTSINLSNGKWSVQWYNPIEGGGLTPKTKFKKTISAPNSSQDWVALLTKK